MTPAAPIFSERESVRKICGRLQQAYRGYRLYPADHPTARRAFLEFYEALAPHLEQYGSIELRIAEDEILFEDEQVYAHADPRGSLAFLMFRDGIRLLILHPGIDEAEAEALADCLSHADQLAAMEYDLPTALWERDLQHVEYEVVDPFLGSGGEKLRDAALNDLRDTVLRRLSELNPGGNSAGDSPTGGEKALEDGEDGPVGGTIADDGHVLTQADLDRTEWALEGLKDTLGDFAVVLLEIAGWPGPDAKADSALARSLGLVAEKCFDEPDIGTLECMVDRIVSLVSAGRRPPGFGTEVFAEAATTERLARLIGLMGQAGAEQTARIEGLLPKMRDWVLPALLDLLAESDDKAVRRMALELLEAEGGVPLSSLWPLMEDPRWYVVRNAVALATRSGVPSLSDHLEPLLRHAEARVRREVIRSLDAAAGPRAAMLLARALSDSDVSVRVLAANALGRHGSRNNLASVQAQIDARDFPTRPAEEIAAFLTVYAILGSDAAVGVLNKLWRRKLFGAKPLPLRLGAISALGLVGTPSAREALNEALKAEETQIQRAAAKALAESRSRVRGERL